MNNLSFLSSVHTEQSVMPNLVTQSPNAIKNAINSDFIRHPDQYPLQIKKLRRWPWTAKADDYSNARIGLCIHSAHYVTAGSQIELTIPLRGDRQSFIATVVLVRELPTGFELGLWFDNQADEARAKIVEKICETECGLGDVAHRLRPNKVGKHDFRDWLHDIAKPLFGHWAH